MGHSEAEKIMKNMRKISLVGLAAFVVALGIAGSASAKTTSKTYSGKVESVAASTFELKVGSRKYTIEIDANGKINGYYGSLFYGIEPTHERIDPLFQKLGIDKNKGDGLLVVGTTGNYMPRKEHLRRYKGFC